MVSKKIIALLLVLLPVLISGCVLPSINPFDSNTPVGTGVVIEDFRSDMQDNIFYSGENVKFMLKVKNTGSVKAESGFADLLGLDYVWKPLGPVKPGTSEVFPDENYCRYDVKQITLLPEDKEAGTTGAEITCSWRYAAPDVLPGLSINSKPRVRFYYTYRSSTIKTITLVSRDELKALQEQGKGLPSESYSSTNSPISIDIETASPIRTYGNKVEFPIVITVKNIGGGTVCMDESGNCKKTDGLAENQYWNKFYINIELSSDLGYGSCQQSQQIFFVGNNPQTVSCKIIAENSSQIGINQKNIEVWAKYGYFIDKTIEVNVYSSNKPNSPS